MADEYIKNYCMAMGLMAIEAIILIGGFLILPHFIGGLATLIIYGILGMLMCLWLAYNYPWAIDKKSKQRKTKRSKKNG
jgi:hypothetical protein